MAKVNRKRFEAQATDAKLDQRQIEGTKPMIHEEIIKKITECNLLSKEETAKAIGEINERIASKTINIIPFDHPGNYDLSSLFEWEKSPLGHDFWSMIKDALNGARLSPSKTEE